LPGSGIPVRKSNTLPAYGVSDLSSNGFYAAIEVFDDFSGIAFAAAAKKMEAAA